uniref:TLC domain-containing protein n=1 Tax=Parascaris equorum TaxID=6256 RepID=A0A914RFM0_PAREQ
MYFFSHFTLFGVTYNALLLAVLLWRYVIRILLCVDNLLDYKI